MFTQVHVFTQELKALVEQKHLLKHPFYQMWEEGTLPIEVMRSYAKQYYHLERNFPNFLSLMLMSCDDEAAREKILENFDDETRGKKNHRELWLRFGETIGVSREEMKNSQMLPETAETIEVFKAVCAPSFLSGAAALAAYESQIPAIAQKKLEGLVKHYGIVEEEGTEFFRVHAVLDVHHAQVWWDLIENYAKTEEQKRLVIEALTKGRDALWNFLSGVLRAYMPEAAQDLESTCTL